MKSLNALKIRNSRSKSLGSLPAGPYLSCLESLCLDSFTAVPANLAAATQLRHLDLGSYHSIQNYSSFSRIEVTEADVAALCSVPALASLYLQRPWHMARAPWHVHVAQLRAQLSADGRVPPEIIVFV